MATYIRNNSMDNLQRALEQLAMLNTRRKDRQFDQARYLNSIGKNQEGEQLIAQSQRGLLGNLFAGEAEGRKFDNPYAGPERSLLEAPKLNAQQEILAELQGLYDGDQGGYQQNIQALAADMTNRGIQEQGISRNNGRISQPMWNDAAALFGQNLLGIKGNEQAVQRQAQVQAQNEAIKKANAERYFEGDEDDVIDSLTQTAYREIQNAPTYQEKLKKYAQYKNKFDSVRKSFQGAGRALDMEQMGVIKPASTGGGSRGGSSEKPERAYVYDQDGKRIESVLLTQSEFNDPNRNQILFDKYQTISSRGGDPSLINVSFASGTSKEPDPMDVAAMKEVERQRTAKDQNAVKMLNQVTGWDVGSSDATRIHNDSEAREWLISRGYEIVEKPDGKYTIRKPQGRNTQMETRNIVPQNKSVSDWLE
jgi:hypothetical protein